jgi:chromosome segregation ATPase
VGQLAEQATAVATAVETVVEKGVELPDLLSQWGSSAETLANQLQPLNEGALGEHRKVVTETATAYRDTVSAQAELGTQIGTLAGQLESLQDQLETTNTRLDEGIEKHRDYDRSLEETGEKLDDFAVTIEETHKALAALVDEEVLGRLAQLNSLLGSVATNLKAVEGNALAAAAAVAQVPQ